MRSCPHYTKTMALITEACDERAAPGQGVGGEREESERVTLVTPQPFVARVTAPRVAETESPVGSRSHACTARGTARTHRIERRTSPRKSD